jgi:anti-sigma B factor antagonist
VSHSDPPHPSPVPHGARRGRPVRQPLVSGLDHRIDQWIRERLGWGERAAVHNPPPDGPGLDVRSRTSAGVCTITVSGEVDCFTAPGLRKVLRAALGRSDLPDEVVVDLHRVTFLDAAGLTALAVAHRRADRVGRALHIRCGTARAVIRPLQITGLWNALNVIEQQQIEGHR